MRVDELEEALSEILPTRFHISTDNKGQIIIYTGLSQDSDGELVDFEDEDEEEDDDFDPDFEPLMEEDDDD